MQTTAWPAGTAAAQHSSLRTSSMAPALHVDAFQICVAAAQAGSLPAAQRAAANGNHSKPLWQIRLVWRARDGTGTLALPSQVIVRSEHPYARAAMWPTWAHCEHTADVDGRRFRDFYFIPLPFAFESIPDALLLQHQRRRGCCLDIWTSRTCPFLAPLTLLSSAWPLTFFHVP